MNIVKMSIHSHREGVLTINKDIFTCISDQDIKEDDIILHPLYSKVNGGDVFTFIVKEVIEQRPSRGDWATVPSTFRKIRFSKETIPGKIMNELGYLKTEDVKNDRGQYERKTFLVW